MLSIIEFDNGKFGISDEKYMLSFRISGDLEFDRRQDCERAIECLHDAGVTDLLAACKLAPKELDRILFSDLAW